MYQIGYLLCIPAGTLLKRPRVLGRDDLFSNFHQTKQPEVALFVGYESHDSCKILLDGRNWTVEIRNVKHNVQEVAC